MPRKAGRPSSVPLEQLTSIGDALYYTERYSVARQRQLCRICNQYAKTREGTSEECKFTVRRYTRDDAMREGGDGIKIVRVAMDYKYSHLESALFSRRISQPHKAADTRNRWDRISDSFTMLGARNADEAHKMLCKQDADLGQYASRIKTWYSGLGQATPEDDSLITRLEEAVSAMADQPDGSTE